MPDVQLIPWRQLSSEALRGILVDVITREGTDVHDTDSFSTTETLKRVMAQLESGRLTITFDEDSGTCNVVDTDELNG